MKNFCFYFSMCVCARVFMLKNFMMCQMKISHTVPLSERTLLTYTHTHICVYVSIPLSVLEMLMRTKHPRTDVRVCVCICVFIITNTILSIKINSTKGNRADASAFFLHSINSSDNPGNNVGSTQPTKKQTISVERLTYTHMCCRGVV